MIILSFIEKEKKMESKNRLQTLILTEWFKYKRNKEKDKMENYSYINRKPEVGDTVQKNYLSNPKYSNRTGVVIRKICGQSIILWDFTKTPVYEFDKDLRILKMEDKPKPAEQYMVAVFGRVTAPTFFDTYEEAESEAKRLLIKEQKKTYILKSVTTMDLGDIKINKSI